MAFHEVDLLTRPSRKRQTYSTWLLRRNCALRVYTGESIGGFSVLEARQWETRNMYSSRSETMAHAFRRGSSDRFRERQRSCSFFSNSAFELHPSSLHMSVARTYLLYTVQCIVAVGKYRDRRADFPFFIIAREGNQKRSAEIHRCFHFNASDSCDLRFTSNKYYQ